MIQSVVLQVPRPIRAVRVMNTSAVEAMLHSSAQQAMLSQELANQNQQLTSALSTLASAAAKVNAFYEQAVAAHNADIAKLAVEIARKILAQEVSEKQYQIELLIAEAIKDVSAHEDIIVHVSIDDEKTCRVLQSERPELLAQFKIVADPKIKNADCAIETPAGLVECFVESKLAKITDALVNHHE